MAHEVDTASSVHAVKSSSIKTSKATNKAKPVQDSGVGTDSVTVTREESESPDRFNNSPNSFNGVQDSESATIIQTDSASLSLNTYPPNVQTTKTNLEENGEIQSGESITATLQDGVSSHQDKPPITGNINVQAKGATQEASRVIRAAQDEAGDAMTSEKEDTVTAESHENVGVTDSFKATVIPGPERATHHSLNDSAATEDSIGFTPYGHLYLSPQKH